MANTSIQAGAVFTLVVQDHARQVKKKVVHFHVGPLKGIIRFEVVHRHSSFHEVHVARNVGVAKIAIDMYICIKIAV